MSAANPEIAWDKNYIDGQLIKQTFVQISSRMQQIGIKLEEFMDIDYKPPKTDKWDHGRYTGAHAFSRYGIEVAENTLKGIKFRIKKPSSFVIPDPSGIGLQPDGVRLHHTSPFFLAVSNAMKDGRKVFAQGKHTTGHWALDASMAVTDGIGFREIAYIRSLDAARKILPADRDGSINVGANSVFSSQFGESNARLDISSLHLSISGTIGMIHIDHTGFTMSLKSGELDDVFLTPDFMQHAFVELLQRDILKLPDNIEVYLPNSANDFARTGVRFKGNITPTMQVALDFSHSFRDPLSENGSLTLNGGQAVTLNLIRSFGKPPAPRKKLR